MGAEKTTPVRSKIMVYLGQGKVKGPRDKVWDCPDTILGELLEQDAIEIVEGATPAAEEVSPEIKAIMDELNKAEISAELQDANQSFDPKSKKEVLAGQLLAVRTDQAKAIMTDLTVDEIQAELTELGQEYGADDLEAVLASLLVTARRLAQLSE